MIGVIRVVLTSGWLCAGVVVVVVLVLTSHRVGTESRLSVLMKDWVSAYSDSESAGDENREFVERSSMQDRSWRQRRRGGVNVKTSDTKQAVRSKTREHGFVFEKRESAGILELISIPL